jgi:hypothetical protein
MRRRATIDWENLPYHVPHTRTSQPHGNWSHIFGDVSALDDRKTQGVTGMLFRT